MKASYIKAVKQLRVDLVIDPVKNNVGTILGKLPKNPLVEKFEGIELINTLVISAGSDIPTVMDAFVSVDSLNCHYAPREYTEKNPQHPALIVIPNRKTKFPYIKVLLFSISPQSGIISAQEYKITSLDTAKIFDPYILIRRGVSTVAQWEDLYMPTLIKDIVENKLKHLD